MNHCKYLILMPFMLIITAVSGQSKKKADATIFSLQMDYLSNYIYNGRADSIKAPYQTTTASIHLTNGFFSNFSASYLLTKGEQRFDYFQLDLGYEYKIGENIYGDIYGTKYFYAGQSNLLNGNISSDIGVSFNYDFKVFQLNSITDVFFSGKTDFQFTPGIEKTIYLTNNQSSSLSINPYLYSTFSTLNYYESNITRRLNGPNGAKGNKGSNTNAPIIQNSTTLLDKGLKLLNIDFSMPITYENNRLSLIFSPTYSNPFNKISTITTNTVTPISGIPTSNSFDSTPYSELHLSNQFFYQFSLIYKF